MKYYISRYVCYATKKKNIVVFILKNHLHYWNGYMFSTLNTLLLKPCSCIWGVIQIFDPY